MKITVKEILSQEQFNNFKIVAGKKGIERKVQNVSFMEVPDILPYVGEDTFLLTTLFPIHNDEEAIKNLIPNLNEKGLSGIAIKPARYVSRIPKQMIQQANALSFPIIELPDDANLSNISNEILKLTLDRYIDTVSYRNYIHEHLMKLFLRGEGLEALIENFSQIIKYPVLLFNRNLELTITSKDLETNRIEYTPYKYEATSNELNLKITDPKDSTEYYPNDYYSYPIKAGDDFFGYIVILSKASNPNIKVAIEQGALLIASVFHKNKAILEKERNFLDAFIRDILKGKMKSQVEAIERAKAFGWEMNFPQVIVVLKKYTKDPYEKKMFYERLLESNNLEKVIAEELNIYMNKIKAVYLDDSLVIFLDVLFLKKIENKLKVASKKIIESFGLDDSIGLAISSRILSTEQLPDYYELTQDALTIGRRINNGSFYVFQDETKIFRVIKNIKDESILKDFMIDKLGKIIEYDQQNNLQLLETLSVLIKNNFNLQEASKEMFIHYNTMRYRVKKLKSLGLNYENGYLLGELILAYQIYVWLSDK